MASQQLSGNGSIIVHPKVNKLNIKLSKISSARRLYEKSSKELEKLYLEVIADESKSHNSNEVRKFPSSQAFHVLKKVTNTVRANSLPIGHTTLEKLSCIRVDAASEMLKSSTWRKFFETEHLGNKIKRDTPQKASNEFKKEVDPLSLTPTMSNSNAPISPLSASAMSLHIRKQEMAQNMDNVYKNLLYRVEDLWDTLKISLSDRKYYRKSLLSGQKQNAEQCRALASYILFLQQYKSATIEVLKTIKYREWSVAKFYELFAALQRKHSRLQVKDIAFKTSSNSSLMSTDPNDLAGVEVVSAWKEELLYVLDEVRCNTLDVVKAIQLWRRNLWRPLPFIWNNTNYLSKIKNDMNILESESSQRILNLLPMRFEDLLGVVFFDFRDAQANNDIGGPESPDQENKADRSPAMSPLPVGSSIGNSVSNAQNLVSEFLANIPISELREAAMVVIDDEKLQQAVKAEHDALIQQGFFIPSLKLKTKSSSGRKHRKNRAEPPEQEAKEDGVKTANIEIPPSPLQQVNMRGNSDAISDVQSNISKSIVHELSTAEMQSIISASFPPYKPFIYDPVDDDDNGEAAVGEQALEEADKNERTGSELVNAQEEKSNNLQDPSTGGKSELDLSLFDFFELEEQREAKPQTGKAEDFAAPAQPSDTKADGVSPPRNTKDTTADGFPPPMDPNADRFSQTEEDDLDGDDENLYNLLSVDEEDDGVVRNDKKNKNYSNEDRVRMDLSEFTKELKGMMYGEEEISFDDSKADVDEGKLLYRVALFLRKYPQIDINIESHTECIGPHGQQLCADDMNCASLLFSEQRATAIEEFLRGLGCTNHFMCRGWGCKHPTVGPKKLIRIFP